MVPHMAPKPKQPMRRHPVQPEAEEPVYDDWTRGAFALKIDDCFLDPFANARRSPLPVGGA